MALWYNARHLGCKKKDAEVADEVGKVVTIGKLNGRLKS